MPASSVSARRRPRNPVSRQRESGAGRDRVHDQRSELPGVPADDRLTGVRIVEGQHYHIADHPLAQPGGGRHGAGSIVRAERGPERRHVAYLSVLPGAVVGPLELRDLRASGMGLGRAQGADHRFRPGVAKSDLLERRDAPAQGLRHLHLELGRTIEARPAGRLFAHRLDHRGVRVPQDQDAIVVHEVEKLVAVHIVDARALPTLQVHRKGAEVDAGAGVAAGHRTLRPLEERFRTNAALAVAADQVVQPRRDALSFHYRIPLAVHVATPLRARGPHSIKGHASGARIP